LTHLKTGEVRLDHNLFDVTGHRSVPNTTFNFEAVKTWVKALESGNYKQYRGALVNGNGRGFCCLGVACKTMDYKVKKDGSYGYFLTNDEMRLEGMLDDVRNEILGINEIEDQLINMNDGNGDTDGASFTEIAQYLRKYYAAWGYSLEE
jgi:hypothetical protein